MKGFGGYKCVVGIDYYVINVWIEIENIVDIYGNLCSILVLGFVVFFGVIGVDCC